VQKTTPITILFSPAPPNTRNRTGRPREAAPGPAWGRKGIVRPENRPAHRGRPSSLVGPRRSPSGGTQPPPPVERRGPEHGPGHHAPEPRRSRHTSAIASHSPIGPAHGSAPARDRRPFDSPRMTRQNRIVGRLVRLSQARSRASHAEASPPRPKPRSRTRGAHSGNPGGLGRDPWPTRTPRRDPPRRTTHARPTTCCTSRQTTRTDICTHGARPRTGLESAWPDSTGNAQRSVAPAFGMPRGDTSPTRKGFPKRTPERPGRPQIKAFSPIETITSARTQNSSPQTQSAPRLPHRTRRPAAWSPAGSRSAAGSPA